MGKPVDQSTSCSTSATPARTALRCVHCRTAETPLWRTGPDGAKTLCNACGVRFKKGKLVLYRTAAGELTAVKQPDSAPVVVPPPPKKAPKKSSASMAAVTAAVATVAASARVKQSASHGRRGAHEKDESAIAAVAGGRDTVRNQVDAGDVKMEALELDFNASPRVHNAGTPDGNDSTRAPPRASASAPVTPSWQASTAARKAICDSALDTIVAKKIRGRSRRLNAGQLPGRYHMASRAASMVENAEENPLSHLPSQSPPTSLRSAPCSPPPHDLYPSDDDFILRGSPPIFNVHEPSPYPLSDPTLPNGFPDVACLGLDGPNDQDSPTSLSLPLMAADPSSAEHFSFPGDAVFSADASLVFDPPDQRTAFIDLVKDRSRSPGRLYHACVRDIAQLTQRLIAKSSLTKTLSPPERREFVRFFAAELGALGSGPKDDVALNGPLRQSVAAARLMLPDRAAYDTAADALCAMMDCVELSIFPEDVVFQVLEDDVDHVITSPEGLVANDTDGLMCFGVASAGNPIDARA